jgi:hypothetical protein
LLIGAGIPQRSLFVLFGTLSHKVFGLQRALVLTVGLLTACASQDIDHYAQRRPDFDPQQYFNGNLTAHGVLKNRRGEVTRYFNAAIKAYWRNGIGTLEERFVFDDGEIQYRTWILRPDAKGGYLATAGDVIGEGQAQVVGNAMNLQYTLRVNYRSDTLDLAVDDWMYRVDDNTVINESVLRKFGFKVGSIQLAIIRQRE